MTPSACLQSAHDILEVMQKHPQLSVADALKDWASSHRFAGSSDRARIAGLLYDCLRCKTSAQWQMGGNDPRSLILGMLKRVRQYPLFEVESLYSGNKYAPFPLTDQEKSNFERDFPVGASDPVAGDFPPVLEKYLTRSFGDDIIRQMQAMICRAPLDLRVNSLKADRTNIFQRLAYNGKVQTPYSPWGIRIPFTEGKAPKIHDDPAYIAGEIEIQDEGSQIISLIAGSFAKKLVIDLCAGGGGKTLALAASIHNRGQIFAHDKYSKRLEPIRERLKRAGTTNVSLIFPDGAEKQFQNLRQKADLVVVDAPCSGSGTWRRNPEEKWKLSPAIVQKRMEDQRAVLEQAYELVTSGGHIAYMTCSLFHEENDDIVTAFLENHPDCSCVHPHMVLEQSQMQLLEKSVIYTQSGIMLTPMTSGTDGFYVSILKRKT